MNDVIGFALGAIGAVAGSVAMLWVYFDSKEHKEHIEDQDTESTHMTAMSSASETLAAAVNVLIQPLNDSIKAMQQRELLMAKEMAHMKAEILALQGHLGRMTRDMEAIVRYVRMLWSQIKEHGSDPVQPPPELAHVVWDDETGKYTEG